jgi:hypothetical protein
MNYKEELMGKQRSVLDYIESMIKIESGNAPISYDEWCYIRRNGSPDEIAEAVERMELAGGYENLE